MGMIDRLVSEAGDIEVPQGAPELIPALGSEQRTAPVPPEITKVDSFMAGVDKNWLLSGARELASPDRGKYYPPTEEDLTQYPELLEGVPYDEQHKVLSRNSKEEAAAMQRDILEEVEGTRIQYANGGFIGFAGELASYVDPLSVTGGNGFIRGINGLTKAYRASRKAKILAGAGSLGALSGFEEKLRQYGNDAADEEDVVYATAAGLAFGAGLTAFMTRSGKAVGEVTVRDMVLVTDASGTETSRALTVLRRRDGPAVPIHDPLGVEGTLALPTPERGMTVLGDVIEISPYQYKQITYTGTDGVIELGVHIDNTTAELGASVKSSMDETLVKDPGMGERPMNVSDEAFDVTGAHRVIDETTPPHRTDTTTQNFSAREHQMAQEADELAANGQVSDPKVLAGLRAYLKINPLMTDGLRSILSKSKMSQVIGSHFGELATGIRGKVSTTAAMHKRVFETRLLSPMNSIIRQSQTEFLSRRGIKPMRNFLKYNGKGKQMFDDEVMLEMGRRHEDIPSPSTLDPAIKTVADELDRVLKEGLLELKKAGWHGADAVQVKRGSVPLVWKGSAMAKLSAEGRLGDLKELIQRGYQSVGFSPELSSNLADAVIARNLSKAADLDFNPAALFTQAGRGDLEAMLRASDVSELNITGIMKKISKETSGMPKRTNIDLTSEYNGLRILDVIDTNIENLMTRQVQRTGGKVGIAKKGAKSLDDIASMIKVAKSQATHAGEDAEKLGKSLEAIFDELLARPVNGGVHRMTRRALDYSMITKLGQLGFPQLAEMANISAAHGFMQSITSVPMANKIYKQLKEAVRTGDFSKVDKAFMAEIQVIGGSMIDEHLLYRTSVHLDETADSGWWAVADNISAVARDSIGMLSGMYRIKGVEQTMTLMLQAEKVAKLMKGKTISKAKLKRLAEVGWDEKAIARIKKQMDKHATFHKGTLDRLNLEKWDEIARAEYVQGLHRHVNQVIQLPMAGEGSYWMHTSVGALIMQFRSFPMLAIEKQTGRHMIAGDQEALAAVMYGAGWSSIASMAKAYTNAQGRKDKQEYLAKHMTPDALIQQAMNYNSSMSMLPDIGGGVKAAFGIGEGGGRWGSSLTPPVISGAQRALSGGADLLQGNVTERAVRNSVSAIPLMSIPPAAIMTNKAAAALQD